MKTLINNQMKDGKINIEIKPTDFGCYGIYVNGEPILELISAKDMGKLNFRELLEMTEKF